jgi:hypothetical protein
VAFSPIDGAASTMNAPPGGPGGGAPMGMAGGMPAPMAAMRGHRKRGHSLHGKARKGKGRGKRKGG